MTDSHHQPYRWAILAVATFTQAATAFVFLGVGALAGFVQEDLGLTGTQTGLLVTAVGLVPLFLLLMVGRMLDHLGERAIIPAGALLLAAGAAGATLAPDYGWILLLLLLGGTGYATSQPGGSKAVAGWFATRQRGLAMGIRQTGLPLGGALAASTLPSLAAAFGWRPALGLAAAVTAIGGLAFGLVYRRSALAAGEPARFGPQIREVALMPAIRPVLISGVVMVSAQFSAISYLMLYLRDRHGLPLTSGAWLLATAQFLGVAGRIVLASWSDRLGPARRMSAVLLSLVAACAGAALLALVPSGTPVWVLVGLAAVYGFFTFGWYGPWVVHVAEIAPAGAIGLTLGLAMTSNQLGIVLAPPLFGLLLDSTGSYLWPWLAVAAVLALVAVFVGRSQPGTSSA